MKKLILFGVILSLYTITCFAQKYPNNHRCYKNFTKKESKIFFNVGDTLFSRTKDALEYLKNQKEKYDLPADAIKGLVLKTEKHSLTGSHLIYQQYINNILIEGAELIISLDNNGKIIKSYHNLHDFKYISSNNKLSKEAALDTAWNHLRVHGKLMSLPVTNLLYIPYGDSLYLCYKVYINSEAPWGYWGLNIDANTGEVLEVYEAVISEKCNLNLDFNVYSGLIMPKKAAIKNYLLNASKNKKAIKSFKLVPSYGVANLFIPDPMTRLNKSNLMDGFPPDSFSGAYRRSTLMNIDVTDGVWHLTGPWVQIVDFEAPNTAPSTTTDGAWLFHRGNNGFNDAMTYYHIDENQRYVQSLGYTGTNGIQNLSIEADADGLNGADNSNFDPVTNRLAFGHGGVDDNEDAEVILHEYMHALLYDINNNYWPPTGDLGALGEGFGDYWGGSYSYSCPNGQTFNPNWWAKWDGHSTGMWGGRVLNRTNSQYNPNITYDAHDTINRGTPNWFISDELWSAPLFQSLLDIVNQGGSREQMDRIALQSNFGLGANVTMRQMARSIVNTADILYPDNIHAPILLTRFSNQNFVLHDIYVNASHSGTEDGSAANPFNTIQEGYDAVLPSGTLHISSGNYNIGSLTLNKRMTIVAEGGTITIGY